jgi:hypothetical protein
MLYVKGLSGSGMAQLVSMLAIFTKVQNSNGGIKLI